LLRKPQKQRQQPGNAKQKHASANPLKQPESISCTPVGQKGLTPELRTNEVLCSILGMTRRQAENLDRQHGSLVAVSETIETHPNLRAELKKHPFHNQSPREDRQITTTAICTIDAASTIALDASRRESEHCMAEKERIRFIDHLDKRILSVDLSNCPSDELEKLNSYRSRLRNYSAILFSACPY
jgi:hypothetical protein